MAAGKAQLWPYGVVWALLIGLGIVAASLTVLGFVFQRSGWPGEDLQKTLLIGILVVAITPLALTVLDSLAERRAVLEYGGAKLDFSKLPEPTGTPVTVPTNIGIVGQAIADSATSLILNSLQQAVGSDVVVIDLEGGDAWWETRLLVLLAGAARLQRPGAVVFVANDGGVARHFQGWARPSTLLRGLLAADPEYARSYWDAHAAGRQWELVPPGLPGAPGAPRPQGIMQLQGLALAHQWMATDGTTGLPNELAEEQFLAADLGARIEVQHSPRAISISRLQELFRPVLRLDAIDEALDSDSQLTAFLTGASPYVAVTRRGVYQRLLSREAGLGAVVGSLISGRRKG